MSSDTNVSDMFSAALGGDAPAAKPAAKSSCCGPKTEVKIEPTEAAAVAAAPKASSCCGPKPAATETAPKAKSSCCG
ncbi:hypothetical protein [Lentzea sp. NPDC059081]|uniref:hypothetical protein n=1 Tax=Lentzea sp. NPDC059081 TaxID=3346719 RepID=UPI00367FBFF7